VDVWVVLGMFVWTAASFVLLFLLMAVDALFTGYRDLAEIRDGNLAVTVRFVMKLGAQGVILARSIATSNELWQALLASAVSFVILMLLELAVRLLLRASAKLDLDRGTKEGKANYGLFAGSLHLVGALVLAASL